MRVRFTQQARRELDAILEYVSRDDPRAAMAIAERVERFSELTSDFPQLGRRTGIDDVRVWPIPQLPYPVFFRVQGRELQVVSIRHAKRRRVMGS